VVALLAQGVATNQELAERMVISKNTVRYHVANILWKLGLNNRAQVVVYAHTHGALVSVSTTAFTWQPRAPAGRAGRAGR
jgi:DNA-binding NarL/FixJ family response regulator